MHNLFRRFLALLALASLLLFSGTNAMAAISANGKWSWDPAKEGMIDLRAAMPIEGCNVPGGLRRVTDSDEPSSVKFWCGEPPQCLQEGTSYAESCKFVPFCRREPRGDPNGIPGANGCRDPEDLICVSTGLHPVNGVCPLPPVVPPPPPPPPPPGTCPDGSDVPASGVCPDFTPASCPPGYVMSGMMFCVPDGSGGGGAAGPAASPEPTPAPPPVQYCPNGQVMPPTGCPPDNPAPVCVYDECGFLTSGGPSCTYWVGFGAGNGSCYGLGDGGGAGGDGGGGGGDGGGAGGD